jgi:hypothetical protein
MSHHFDTQLVKEDPSLNECDFYLFQGGPDTTVMAMTVNPDVGLSAPDTLHIEGLYAFRFDLNEDAREEVVFKFRFREPKHVNGDEHVHVQKFQVRRATANAIGGDKGELLMEGETGKVHSESGIPAYVAESQKSRKGSTDTGEKSAGFILPAIVSPPGCRSRTPSGASPKRQPVGVFLRNPKYEISVVYQG